MTLLHHALFYRDRSGFLAGVLPPIEKALTDGTPVLAAVPEDRGDLLRHALDWRYERIRVLDMAIDGRNPTRIIPAVLHAFVSEHGGDPVLIIGEPVWPGRTAAEYPACVQHEALINMVFTGTAATVICPYDARRLEPEVLSDAAATHPTLIVSGEYRASRSYRDPAEVVSDFNRPLPDPPPTAAVMVFDGVDDLPTLREFVGRNAARSGLPHDRVVDLQVAANELATNTVRHAGGPGVIRLWVEDGHVVCDVTDGGHIADPLVGRLPPAISSEGGRGLLLTNYLCDLVRLYTRVGSTSVRAFVRLG